MMSPSSDGEALWRLFLASWPDEAFLDSLAPLDRWLQRLNTHRIIPREQRHLTLAFLGDAPPAILPRLIAQLEQSSSRIAPMRAPLAGTLALPSPRSPRVIAAGLEATPALAQFMRVTLEAAAEAAPSDAVWRDLDRAPKPHVTVARTRRTERARRLDLSKAPPLTGVMNIAEVAVVRSRLTPAGPTYETLERIALHGENL